MKCKVKKVKRGRRMICDPGICDHCTYVGEGDFLCDNTADEAYNPHSSQDDLLPQ